MRRGLDDLLARAQTSEKGYWRSWDLMGVESEVAEFLYALVRATKPARVVESGAGFSTCFLAAAVEDNGTGTVTSYEADPEHAAKVRQMVAAYPGVTVMSKPLPEYLKALFLGPKAENAELVERLLSDSFRDHCAWRRSFRPAPARPVRSIRYGRVAGQSEHDG